MFYAANSTGKQFVAKRVWADGDVTVSNKMTFETSEAFVFATVEAAEASSKKMFSRSAGPAVPVGSVAAVKPVNTSFVAGLPRPTRHQQEEAAIHGDHELYT